ncbi:MULTISPECIES: hypothetical protein [unclassified Micromonospora]|uniref:hypothetical protein n=1 Tax=unclassified Micromonospora TaxID=2617518 RepID=UPI0022B74B8F|nr:MULTISPECIES: hypothetical protein [unclassified Micromonospora]MCZ7420725.1 hypothetical protein [Verrucosispora sp. WMMA2121]WBB88815.1 hypothetical protein O7597_17360 [Verrucosispora sp. WMMC514]
MDRKTADRLLDADPVALSQAGPLAAPLRAARGPARPDEMAGEHLAVAAFRAAADLAPESRPRRESMLRSTLAKLLTVKAATVVAATGLGGVALAAGTGALPDPVVDPTTRPATHAPAAPTATPSLPAGPADRAGVGDSPSPSLTGLCQAYAAGAANPGKASENPAFAELVEAAGGAGQVDEYCADAASKDRARPTGAPGGAGRPTTRPTPNPRGTTRTSRPDAAITKRPGGVPTVTVPGLPAGSVPAATPRTPGR